MDLPIFDQPASPFALHDCMETKFSKFLSDEYQKLKTTDQNFSINKFSKQLGINSGTLSHFISGQRKVTIDTALKLGRKLGLKSTELHELTADLSLGQNLEMLDANSLCHSKLEINIAGSPIVKSNLDANKPLILTHLREILKLLASPDSEQKFQIHLDLRANQESKDERPN
jgi:plasmid maintenance system antidote protein VapI